MDRIRKLLPLVVFVAGSLSLAAGDALAAPPRPPTLADIETVVVIYGENRSFDNLYGLFPGADGIAAAMAQARYRQVDADGGPLPRLPPVWQKQADGRPRPHPDFPADLPNRPFRIDAPPVNHGLDVRTPDLVHRFYQNQEQIDGGRNDRFAAVSDAGGLVMGHYDGRALPLFRLAQRYVLADRFFMGAFGGSFLNHFWLVCACTPTYAQAPAALVSVLDADGRLLRRADSPASARQGPPTYVNDGAVTPDGFAVNTLQPPYQPSALRPDARDPALAERGGRALPPQTAKTVGDTLSARGIAWKWYAGGWNAALADRAEHLKDESELLADIAHGSLPQVVFYKPQGSFNEHPGYADVLAGDRHIAEIVRRLQASPQWRRMAIIITYDENGGFWDHVAPPAGDRWGPGTRVPAIVVSPFARRGYVDHTPYDTTSIIKFLTRRFDLEPLPGVRPEAGDMTAAFAFGAQR